MCTLASLFAASVPLVSEGEMTVTQASRAPGREPSERCAAVRNEKCVASVAPLNGTATMTMGTSSICVVGSGLGL